MTHVRLRCEHNNTGSGVRKCGKEPQEWEGDYEPHDVAVVAIWFHAHHEGHDFSYWRDGQLILGPGDNSHSKG